MEKAYDLSALAAQLKGRGLDLAEESLKIVVHELFVWVSESAKLSATPYDDMALLVLPHLEKLALDQVDKIDGQVG